LLARNEGNLDVVALELVQAPMDAIDDQHVARL
jgi:hypothetical protein